MESFGQGFGEVAFVENTNIKKSGSGNQGTVQSTTNLKLFVSNCILSLFQSTNQKISGKNSTITCSNSTNADINGDDNTVVFEECSNAKFVGNGCNLKATSSTNLKLVAEASKCVLSQVTNAKLSVESLKMDAENCTNIQIEGIGGQLNLKNLKNHKLQRTNESTVEIYQKQPTVSNTLHGVGRWLHTGAAWMLGNIAQPNVVNNVIEGNIGANLTFKDKVEIEGNNYLLDKFKFLFRPITHQKFEVEFQSAVADTLHITHVGPGEYLVSITQNGVKHLLKFIAPTITRSITNQHKSLTVEVNSVAQL